MGNTNATTPLVHPSQSDVNGGVANDGKRLLEKYIREWHKALSGISYVISGGVLPSSAANRDLIIPAGVAFIAGYYVTWASTTIVNLTASTTNHIFVKLTFASGLVSGVQMEDNTTGTHPADSVKLGTVTTSAGAIISSVDQRLLDGAQRIRRAVISATGTTSWIVPANVTRLRVRQWGAGGGGGGGGGGDGASNAGSAATNGQPGAYVESVVTVTPGETLTVTNGTGGSGGPGGNAGTPGADGQNGNAGGASSVSGLSFNFSAAGGDAGLKGFGYPPGGPAPAPNYKPNPTIAQATQTSGTADLLLHGGGRQGGRGTDGAVGNASGGAAGQHGVTILEY